MGQSDLHRDLSEHALIWLESKATGRGIRGCVEMIISNGYIVDAGAVCGLTMANEKLFLGESNRDALKKDADDYSFVFESKVSRADFMNTFKNGNHGGDRMAPVANFHFIVTPFGLVSENEVPEFWGLLEQRGCGLSIKKFPVFIETEIELLYKFSYLLMRSIRYSKFHLD